MIDLIGAALRDLAERYPRVNFLPGTLEKWREELRRFPADIVARVVVDLARESDHFPSLAKMLSACRTLEGKRAAQAATPRLLEIARWRSHLENPEIERWVKTDSRERLSDTVPPVTQAEWDEARGLNERTHAEWTARRRKEDREDPPLLAVATYREPPPKSYRGIVPAPGEAAYIVPRYEAAAILRGFIGQITAVYPSPNHT